MSVRIAGGNFWRDVCLREMGRVLDGKFAHYCNDWDGMPMDETMPEFAETCTCFPNEPAPGESEFELPEPPDKDVNRKTFRVYTGVYFYVNAGENLTAYRPELQPILDQATSNAQGAGLDGMDIYTWIENEIHRILKERNFEV